jgi:hypothetical protein
MKNTVIKANEKKINWVGTNQWFKLTQTHIDRLDEYKAWMDYVPVGGSMPEDKARITKLQNHIKLAYLYPTYDVTTKSYTYDSEDCKRRVDELRKGIYADFITDTQAKFLNNLEYHYQCSITDLDLSDSKVRACAEVMLMWGDSVEPTYSIDLKKKGNDIHYQVGRFFTINQYNKFIHYCKQLNK